MAPDSPLDSDGPVNSDGALNADGPPIVEAQLVEMEGRLRQTSDQLRALHQRPRRALWPGVASWVALVLLASIVTYLPLARLMRTRRVQPTGTSSTVVKLQPTAKSSTATKVQAIGIPATGAAIPWFSPATIAKVKSWFTLRTLSGPPPDYSDARDVLIFFDFDRATLRPESEPALRKIADILSRHPDWKLSLAGYTDNIGPNEYNLALSNRRAVAVKKALVDNFEIAADRLATEGFGATRPSEPNDTRRGRAHNRRVELARE